MDCKHINENEIHDKYLSDSLSDEEKRIYLKHLKTCSSCTNELAKTELSISLIRAAGKRQMKSEIRQQVELIKQRKEDVKALPMILKAAAVIFFLILTPALIYHYNLIPVDRNLRYAPEEIAKTEKESFYEEAEEESIVESENDLSETIEERSSDKTKASQKSAAKKSIVSRQDPAKEKDEVASLLGSDAQVSSGAGSVQKDLLSISGVKTAEKRRSAASRISTQDAHAPSAAPMAIEDESRNNQKSFSFKLETREYIFNLFLQADIAKSDNEYGLLIKAVQIDSLSVILVCEVNEKLFLVEQSDIQLKQDNDGILDLLIKNELKFQFNLDTDPPTVYEK